MIDCKVGPDDRVDDLEAMARTLEASGTYRVLRRLAPHVAVEPPAGLKVRQGLVVDVETRQPSEPISAEITSITGITDEMVAGHSIDPAAVGSFAAGAALVIAHNAAFDRRFLERFCETFTTKAWACSMSQVDWGDEGHEGTKLAYLAAGAGFFYDRHRATNDCLAAVALLGAPLPRSGRFALAQLLERARQPTWRVWAENSPFDLKDVLKARGYRWNGEGTGAPKAWFIDVADGAKEAELAFLEAEIYRGEIELLIRRIDAYDRFSDRC